MSKHCAATRGLLLSASLVAGTGMASKADAQAQSGAPATEASSPSATPQTAPQAGPASDREPQDIVVTATRRPTNLQTTPIAISAVSGEKLESLGARDLYSAANYLPGVSINGTASYGNFPVGIRGIASSTSLVGSDDPVAVYIDGVYVGKPSAVMADLLDVQDIEVVRGPQGTLYGRNASAGAILINHATPSNTPTFTADASYGSFGRWILSASGSGPLADGLDGSLALRHTDMSGWGLNTYDGSKAVRREATSAVGALKVKSGSLEAVLRGDYEDENVHDGLKKINAVPFNASNPVSADESLIGNADTYAFNFPTAYHHKDGGLALNAQVDLGGGTVLHSTTGYRYDKLTGSIDTDGTAANLNTNQSDETLNQFSETLYGTGKGDWGSWIFGVDFYNGRTAINQVVGVPVAKSSLDIIASNDATSAAVFGELTKKFGAFNLTVGGRWTRENKKFQYQGIGVGVLPTFPLTKLDKSWSALTPSARLSWQPIAGLMAYASVASGFKSGGFTALQASAFNPERVLTYEAGLKTTSLGGRLVLDGDVYWSDYKNLQVRVPVSVGVIQTLNAAAATIKGAEFEGSLHATGGLTLTAFANYTDARYDNYVGPGNIQNRGQRLNRAPEWQAGATARYEQPVGTGRLAGEVTWSYRDQIFFQAPNLQGLSSPAYSQFDGRIAYHSANDRWNLSLLVRNLSNERHVNNVIVFASNLVASFDEPRSFEVKLGFHY